VKEEAMGLIFGVLGSLGSEFELVIKKYLKKKPLLRSFVW
jgi:hypothetical protein